MHHYRTDGLGAVVHEMYLLLWTLAFVHVVKFHVVLVGAYTADGKLVVAHVFNGLINHYATHLEIKRLVGGVAVDGHILLEVSQLPGIIGYGYLGFVALGDGALRPGGSGAAATGAHIVDDEVVALVAQFKLGGHRLFVGHVATVDDFVGGGNALCLHGRTCSAGQQGGK